MARTTPRVEERTLVAASHGAAAIAVGTSAWYAWLEQATTFAFVGVQGRFTARKERRGQAGWYWKAYRKRAGVVRSAYLGKTPDLTLECLHGAAATLAQPTMPPGAAPRPEAHLATGIAEPTASASTLLPAGTLTFLFTDIEGSTQLWEQHPQAMPAALARHDAILRQVIESHGGVVFKTVGDGVHAVFTRPGDALDTALGGQRALRAEPWGATGALRVRMALHTGAAELRDGDYFGPPLNRVARILALGHGGQILLSHATHDLVADDLPAQTTLRDLGAHTLKDLSRPEHLFQVVTPDMPADFPPLRTLEAQPARSPQAATPLLATKLFIPALRPNLVPRPRLLDRLGAGLAGPLTLLSAPAGCGKTTIVSAWRAARTEGQGLRAESVTASLSPQSSALGPRVAWVSLDADDNDPARFWSYVITALDTLQPGLAADALPALQFAPAPPIDALLTRMLNALAALPADAVLVLDDYHVIDSTPIHDGVAFVLDHLPPRLHLVITTRADPPLPLARLRARGYLTELRAADLRFTPDEAARFLTEVMGLPLAPDEVAALEARTEGWIAGLQLAALAMRDRADHAGFIAAFTGSNRFVVDYLAAEVLDRMPAHLQTFVLQTAILDRMCGPLCDAVLGVGSWEIGDGKNAPPPNPQPPSPNSQAYSQLILDQLERANLFLMPLDDDRQWYRYHHLFAEVLRERLIRGVPAAAVADLHSRASAWFEQHGFVHEAVQHALLAHDWDAAMRMIEQVGLGFALSGKFVTVLGWIQALPEALVRTRPVLCIAHAAALFLANQMEHVEARLQDAEQYAQAALTERQAAMILGQVVVIRGNMARRAGDIARCIAQSRQALDQLAGSATIGEATALVNTTRAYELSGDVSPTSEQSVRAAITTARASGSVFTHLHALTTLGRLQMLQGRLRAAAAAYAETVRVVGGTPGMHSPAANVGLGELHLAWNDLDAAERQLTPAMDLLRVSPAEDADIVVHGYLAFANVQHARGDHTGARLTLAELIEVARQRAFWPGLAAHVLAARANLALRQSDLPLAAEWAATSGLQPGDDLPYTHTLAYLTLARVWIAQGRDAPTGPFLARALQLLDRLHGAAEADGRMGDMLEILVLRALALQAQGDLLAALTLLADALTLAEPEGYVRIFVDEGAPMAELLRAADQHGIAPAYVARLLAAFPRTEGRGLSAESLAPAHSVLSPQFSTLVEPLSQRELEVLRLIADGYSNQAIADRLVVAVSTIKKHVNNIYGKLDVQSRTQALARARELRLL